MMFAWDGMWFDILRMFGDGCGWHKEAKYTEDQANFLFWEHTIRFACVLNVEATAANRFPLRVSYGETGRRDRSGLEVSPVVIHKEKPFQLAPPPQWQPRGDINLDEKNLDTFGTPKDGGGANNRLNPEGPTTVNRETRTVTGTIGKESLRIEKDYKISNSRPTIPATAREIRERLQLPRRQMLLGMATGPGATPELMLISPLPGCVVDARVGPLCKVIDVREVHGVQSAIFEIELTTWEAPALEFGTATLERNSTSVTAIQTLTVAEQKLRRIGRFGGPLFNPGEPMNQGDRDKFKHYADQGRVNNPLIGGAADVVAGRADAQVEQNARQIDREKNLRFSIVNRNSISTQRVVTTPALLSNRWEMAFKPDPETYLMNQEISGEAQFRADVLNLRRLSADQLRAQFWHPIPFGYVRTEVEVELSPDGLGIKYHFIDKQQLMNFPAGAALGVIRIEVEQAVDYMGYDQVEGTL